MTRLFPAVLALVFLSACAGPSAVRSDRMNASERVEVASRLWVESCREAYCDPGSKVDSVDVDVDGQRTTLYMNDAFAQKPFRDETVATIRAELAKAAPGWAFEVMALGVPMEQLVPNMFRKGAGDAARMPAASPAPRPLVIPLDQPWRAGALAGRHVAVWPSHGWYYEQSLDRWEWQRARLFETVEDLLPMSFVTPYLAPMLERAGAFVHMPRERDTQSHEVIVDNDGMLPDSSRYLEIGPAGDSWESGRGNGFGWRSQYVLQENPFAMGTYRVMATTAERTAELAWVPDIPEPGKYAVYVSWARLDNAAPDAVYTVSHLGGVSRFQVDQRMSGGTWVYLGTFSFGSGVSPTSGAVRLSNASASPGTLVSADAVRFGGGMGSIVRGSSTSGRPRFVEGARYWMQFAGMPADLVYNVTESTNDYVDDYRGRAEWVNYLRGRPYGPNKNRLEGGLDIPVDLSLAFHTDAGVTPDASTIGTLMIYSSTGALGQREFPDKVSRFANRDLGDIMQTQIVGDIRALYDSTWSRRGIWDRDYSEAVRPNVPGVLLELLSHQNFADMRFGRDPRFRQDVARAIYKSVVRFLGYQYGFEPIISPLAPTHAAVEWTEDWAIELRWRSAMDPLEPTADADAFVVYTREDDGAYDNGRLVRGTTFRFTGGKPGTVYRFRIAAVNEGGESAMSEEVAIGRPSADPSGNALIIAAFDRVSAPATVSAGSFRGFTSFEDEGVADGYDLATTGYQYDFDPASPWLDDDAPGHGASYATWETVPLSGNAFNYPAMHGKALLAAGFAFGTASDEWIAESPGTDTYDVLDVILGEERLTKGPGNGRADEFQALPEGLRTVLARHRAGGGALLVSGAYVGTDLQGDSLATAFAKDVLGYSLRTNHAVENGHVRVLHPDMMDRVPDVVFNTGHVSNVYRVESPDAIEPQGDAVTLMRYADNNMSAATGRPGPGGVVVLGFPFETIHDAAVRDRLMAALLDFLMR